MSKKIENMTPDQIASKGRELIRLAKKKETELRQRELTQIGEIIRREINSGWPSSWGALRSELEQTIGTKIQEPHWVQEFT